MSQREELREAFSKVVIEADRAWHGNVSQYRQHLVDSLVASGLFAVAAAPSSGLAVREALFRQQDFIGAGGLPLTWKIECDALSDEDWRTIAAVCAPSLPKFCEAVGVPRGGLRLASAMSAYADPNSKSVLIVDDVWTTGGSMTTVGASYAEWIGFVAFARGPLPAHVKSFMAAAIDALVPGGGVGEALAQRESDIGILLSNLRFLEESTGESLENEDASIVRQIEREHKDRAALASQNEGGESSSGGGQ